MVLKRLLTTLAIEFGPIVVFFFATTYYDFYKGVLALVIAIPISVLASIIKDKRLPWFSILSSTMTFFFGIVTLMVSDPKWIALEYTLYNGIFGAALLISWFFKKPALKKLFVTMLDISDDGWMKLSLHWSLFLLSIAILNELVWNFYGKEVWVSFRLAAVGLYVLFSLYLLPISRQCRSKTANSWGLRSS